MRLDIKTGAYRVQLVRIVASPERVDGVRTVTVIELHGLLLSQAQGEKRVDRFRPHRSKVNSEGESGKRVIDSSEPTVVAIG